MITAMLAISFLGVLGSLIWLVHLAHLIRHRDKVLFLADLPDDRPDRGWPTLAVAFAARDEAGGVEAAARSMLAQGYPRSEVIAVDDRSTDATGAILDAIAREDDRLRVVHVRELPAGWLGKTHALHVAAGATRAEWVLFTDADVVLRPGALRKAVAFAEAEGADLVTVAPEVPTESVGERAFLSIFGPLFAMNAPVGRLGDPRSKAHAGIGAFNLVRAGAFRSIGGFHHLRLSVDDDMRLAQAMKFAGYRMRFLMGRDAVSVRWQVGLGGMVRGLEKNFFAALGYRLDRTAVVILGLLTVGIMPYVGLFVGPWWARSTCVAGIAAVAIILAAASSHSRIGWYYALILPFAAVAVLVSLVRSVALTLLRDGVRWRGHHYPLDELRRHVRIRDAWSREVWKSTR